MYTIKQAAARSGVPAALLRAWERRYDVVAPTRTPSGYRLYDDEAIERLRTMRRLVDAGWAPSTAAAAIVAGDVPVDASPPGEPDAGLGSSGADVAEELADRLVDAAATLDAAELELVLDDLFSRGTFERVADSLLFPALQRLGDAWASGKVSVAGEHLASGAVLRRLALALEGAARSSRARPRILVGLPPGGRHELGALAFAVAARRAGLTTDYLGPDLPVDDWVTATATADAAVIGVVTARDRKAATEVARAIRASRPEVVVAFGGEAAPSEPGVVRLVGRLLDAVDDLSAAVAPAD